VAVVEINISLVVLRVFSAIIFLVLFLNTRERRHFVLFLGSFLFGMSVILRGFAYIEYSQFWSLAGPIALGASALITCAAISYLRPAVLRAFIAILFVTIGAAVFAATSTHSNAAGVWFPSLQAFVLVGPAFIYVGLRREAKRIFPTAPIIVAFVFLTSSAFVILAAFGDLPAVAAATGHTLLAAAQIAVFIYAEHAIVLNDARRIASHLERAEEAVGVGVWERHATDGNAIWSAGHFRIFGLPPDSDSAPNWEEFLSMIHPDDREFIENSQWTETSTGAADLIQYRIVRPDGEVRWISSKAIAIDARMSYGIAIDITALKSTEERLEQSLRQKDSLIAEIQHRVKNNLQVISSMFNLQFVSNHNPYDTQSEIERFRSRLETMAAQQSLVLDSANASEIEMQSYVQQLLGYAESSTERVSRQPSIRTNMNGIYLEISAAITVGSIISEFAYSHTHLPTDHNQTVQVDLEQRSDHYRLAISSQLEETSLEMALVRTYVSQLGGTLAIAEPDAARAITFTSSPVATPP
jgi:two-component sensor histidine kinase